MGRVTPLDNEPYIDEEAGEYIGIFQKLSFSRSAGMGASPIQLSEMAFYHKEIHGIGLLDDFIDIMQGLDSAFLTHHNKKSEDG